MGSKQKIEEERGRKIDEKRMNGKRKEEKNRRMGRRDRRMGDRSEEEEEWRGKKRWMIGKGRDKRRGR